MTLTIADAYSTHAQMWRVRRNEAVGSAEGLLQVTFLSNLSRHTKSVNAVRFSPSGEFLASAGDDGAVVVWKMDDRPVDATKPNVVGNLEADVEVGEETWKVVHLLRAHVEDVYDIAWSPDSSHLASASIDNTVHVWDVRAGKSVQHLKDHKHYVQGVTWSPDGHLLATQSSDRTCRVYSKRFKKNGTSWDFKSHAIISHQPQCTPNLTKDDKKLQRSNATKKPSIDATQSSNTAIQLAAANSTTSSEPSMNPDGIIDAEKVNRTLVDIDRSTNTATGIADGPQKVAGGDAAAASNSSQTQTASASTSSICGVRGKESSQTVESTKTLSCACAETCSCTATHTDISTLADSGKKKVEEAAIPPTRLVRMFQDENGGQSYFRRLNFSPDGSILGTPCGVDHTPAATTPGVSSTNNNTSYFFAAKRGFTSPIFNTPCMDSPSNEIKFCPVAFERRKRSKHTGPVNSLIDLPYRLIFAVMTVNSVIFYDTQSLTPFAMISDLHYAPLTDLSWSMDGNTVVISSQDGYCSILSFVDGELGNVVTLKSAIDATSIDTVTAGTFQSDPSPTAASLQDAHVSSNADAELPQNEGKAYMSADAKVITVNKSALSDTKNPNTAATPTPTPTPAPTPRRIQPTVVNTSGSTSAPKRIAPTLLPSPSTTQLPSSQPQAGEVDQSPQQTQDDTQTLKQCEVSAHAPVDTLNMTTAQNQAHAQSNKRAPTDRKRVGSTTPKRIAPTLITPVNLDLSKESNCAPPLRMGDSPVCRTEKRETVHVDKEGFANKKRSRIAPTLLTTTASPSAAAGFTST
ncbi:hypothetical protein SARC_01314 [Sphaeroforma arctica JP610]|uniref:CAF1B/HIR1 beta-propeller domain-containing protein n=1 Tax=Sphaeroforma arctica JP610 TaxID=667725 RepID=A0A0L0GCB3_9EUKA|nr:hypothetical protein SARC_01314 [Sphaeroforma arctica JP610]KNC86541.1 hypothetical protein SARC_01314 [Sphaeroforma arctica JP610]|eukprot:XP_014160443.1 hypothetical protein SARC_01314 [Sphaeroforma arctica JP610]